MPDPTPGPVRDPEALGRIAFVAEAEWYAERYGYTPPRVWSWDPPTEWWEDKRACYSRMAMAVASVVCPPVCRVVPAADLAALLDAVEDVVGEDDFEGYTSGRLNEAVNRLARTAEALHAALGEELA